MQATRLFYIVVGLLTVVPLILFNVNRVFVKKAPNPLKINWIRGVVILLICALIVTFLAVAYNATLHERYEIALERAAQKHAEALTGQDNGFEMFKNFLKENGTDALVESVDAVNFGESGCTDTVSFQLSSWCIPKYWENQEGFEQVAIVNEENPVYVMYLLDYNGEEVYYAMRMINTEDGWKYDWIGEATEQQQKIIKMPTKKNGKWYTVTD